jgi:hypothetical protein
LRYDRASFTIYSGNRTMETLKDLPVDSIAEELDYLAPLRPARHQLDESDPVPGKQKAGSFGGDIMQLFAIPSAWVRALKDWTVKVL